MNKFILIIIASFTLFSCETNNPEPYSFKIESIRDSLSEDYKLFIATTSLTNNSKDTLKFVTMSCMWDIIYSTSNPCISVRGPEACFKNIPLLITIAPTKSFHRDIILFMHHHKDREGFKLGINIIKMDNLSYFTGLEVFSKPHNGLENEIVWSNSMAE